MKRRIIFFASFNVNLERNESSRMTKRQWMKLDLKLKCAPEYSSNWKNADVNPISVKFTTLEDSGGETNVIETFEMPEGHFNEEKFDSKFLEWIEKKGEKWIDHKILPYLSLRKYGTKTGYDILKSSGYEVIIGYPKEDPRGAVFFRKSENSDTNVIHKMIDERLKRLVTVMSDAISSGRLSRRFRVKLYPHERKGMEITKLGHDVVYSNAVNNLDADTQEIVMVFQYFDPDLRMLILNSQKLKTMVTFQETTTVLLRSEFPMFIDFSYFDVEE